MIDLEKLNKLIHGHHLILLLLLNKHVVMFSRIKENQVAFLFANHQQFFSLEVFVQLEASLKACFESLWSHIVVLLQSSLEVVAKDIPCSNGVFTGEDPVLVFFHIEGKQPLIPGISNLFIIKYCTSFFPVQGQEDTPMKDKVSIEMDHFCI